MDGPARWRWWWGRSLSVSTPDGPKWIMVSPHLFIWDVCNLSLQWPTWATMLRIFLCRREEELSASRVRFVLKPVGFCFTVLLPDQLAYLSSTLSALRAEDLSLFLNHTEIYTKASFSTRIQLCLHQFAAEQQGSGASSATNLSTGFSTKRTHVWKSPISVSTSLLSSLCLLLSKWFVRLLVCSVEDIQFLHLTCSPENSWPTTDVLIPVRVSSVHGMS